MGADSGSSAPIEVCFVISDTIEMRIRYPNFFYHAANVYTTLLKKNTINTQGPAFLFQYLVSVAIFDP